MLRLTWFSARSAAARSRRSRSKVAAARRQPPAARRSGAVASGPSTTRPYAAAVCSGVADVQVVGERLGPVLPRVRGGVGADVAVRPSPAAARCRSAAAARRRSPRARRRTGSRNAFERSGSGLARPAPASTSGRSRAAGGRAACGRARPAASRIASRWPSSPSARSMVITPVVVPGDDRLVRAGQQVEREPVLRVLVPRRRPAAPGRRAGRPAGAWRPRCGRTPGSAAASPSAGRVRVSAQQSHSGRSGVVSQLHAARSALTQPDEPAVGPPVVQHQHPAVRARVPEIGVADEAAGALEGDEGGTVGAGERAHAAWYPVLSGRYTGRGPERGTSPNTRGTTLGGVQPPTVLVVDYGAQYAQLIARRVREAQVYSEIVPGDTPVAEILAREPAAIDPLRRPVQRLRAGRAARRPARCSPRACRCSGICYGFQAMAQALGGEVAPDGTREYGRTELTVADDAGAAARGPARRGIRCG